ncbi:MAG: aminotransferase family protein, partial [Thermodesulfobacteriota bacterium]
NHPRVIQAMREQMEKVIYVTDDFATEPTALLAQKLAHITPGSPNKRVFFSQSGAAAVEAAIRGARMYKYNTVLKERDKQPDAPLQYPFPYKIVSRYRSWHGATAGASSVSGDPRRWFLEPFTVPGVVFAPEANSYRSPFGPGVDPVDAAITYMDYLIEQEGGSNKVAAMIMEPVVGSNGIIPPPEGYMERLAQLCRKWDLLLIADETMTGMGRTGRMLAVEHYGIEPDITVMGKALGAYCPLAATIFSEKVAGAFENNIFGHGQSFSGHALASAAALAGIEVLTEENLIEHAATMGEVLGSRLRLLGEKHRCVGDVRGLGLFWTLEIVKDRETKTPVRKVTEKYEETIVAAMARYLLEEKNVYIPSDKFGIWIVPPLIVSKEEIDFLVEAMDEALERADGWVVNGMLPEGKW